jgi:transposase
MELLSVIRRWHYRDRFSIREISRRTGLSRNTVRKYLRSDSVEPKFAVPDRPSKLDPYADKLSQMLRNPPTKLSITHISSEGRVRFRCPSAAKGLAK